MVARERKKKYRAQERKPRNGKKATTTTDELAHTYNVPEYCNNKRIIKRRASEHVIMRCGEMES